MRALDELTQRVQSGSGPHALIEHLKRTPDPVSAALAAAGMHERLDQLARHASEALALDEGIRLGEIAEQLRDLREALDDLPDLLPLLRAVHAADPAYAWALQRIDQTPRDMEALILDEALRRLERKNPVLAKFGGAGLAQSVRAMERIQRDLFALNAQVVRATWHRRFAEHVRISALSATQLDAAGKELNKRYGTGRRELEHEFSKSMRHRSIRDLCGDETGMVINDIKPIWLMSPLSVSDTLPLSPDLFDVVIFDEYGPTRMIRTEDWKYVYRHGFGPHELYDLVNDPDERTNLVDDPQHADRIAELKTRMDAWFERYVVPELDGRLRDGNEPGQRDLMKAW